MDKIGLMVDAIFCYFTFRGLTGSIRDSVWRLRSFVILLISYVVLVSIERLTGDNPFFVVDGALEVWVDADRIRCRGSFEHPSLLGTLGASFLPLYIGDIVLAGNTNRASGRHELSGYPNDLIWPGYLNGKKLPSAIVTTDTLLRTSGGLRWA